MAENTTWAKALLEAQMEIQAIPKDSSNPYFKSKYFDINTLLGIVKPILNKHGFILLQALGGDEHGPNLTTKLLYAQDGSIIDGGKVPLPKIEDPQKVGSAITYYRRYALQALLALEAEDDDGNDAVKGAKKKVEKKPFVYPTPESEGINLDEPPFEDRPKGKDTTLDDLLN